MSNLKRLEIRAYGLVQGVTFRYETLRVARRLGLTGFVKNEPDGSVLIVAQGSKDELNDLLAWARYGPAWAQVKRTDHTFLNPSGEFEEFTVR